MKKRFLSLFLVAGILMSLFTAFPSTASAETEGIYTYSVLNGKATITDCKSSASGDITIPSTLGGYPVTAIGNNAFYYCRRLTSITIPNSVTSIGAYAFDYCYSLTSVTIPSSVTSLGDGAFCRCSSLTSITIPNSVTSIGENAFSDCESLTSITIPDSVTSIEYGAFSDCTNLTSITIPNSVTSIGGYAFDGCSSLTSITIPDSVTSIEYDAFYRCSSLTSITIPNSVTSIVGYAFGWCSSLTSITIPDSVTSIEYGAFYHCSSLTSITIPDSVTSIGVFAFEGCSSLTDVYYGGREEEWKEISISGGNEALTNATIHYNYTPFDSLFKGSAYDYNHSLARTTFELVETGFSASLEYTTGGSDTSPVAKRRYAKIKKKYDEYGFKEKQKFYNYGIALTDTSDKAAYSMASRDITINGENKKLVALVVRGGNYGGEWVSNFNVGSDTTYSQGFKKPADDITRELKNYISSYKSKDVVLWITGYSRGGAIANLVAANMINYSGNCSYLDANDIFTYTFATPRPVHVRLADADNEKYSNIFNIVNPADVVPQVLLSHWGYGRYGTTKTLFTTVPSQVKKEYKNITGKDYLVPANQKETISEIISLLYKIVGGKNNFNEEYKGIVQDVVYWHFVHKETDAKDKGLIASLSKKYSPNAIHLCYEESQKIVKAYLKAFKTLGVDLGKYQEILSEVGTVCELNDTSIDTILGKVLSNLSGQSINKATLINLLDTLLSLYNAYGSVNGKFGELFTTHEPDVYRAWLFGLDDVNKIYIKGNETAELLDTNANKYKKQLIHCPVDVKVTDKEGNVVVSVVNHEILIDELPVVVIDDKITIYYYDNFEDYNVEITAYEDGEVNYYVSEFAMGEDETKRVCYNSIEVFADDVLTGVVNDEIDTDVSNYNLTLSENVIESTGILEKEQLENLSVTVDEEGSGTVAEISHASKGDYVTLTATPYVGAEFIGWYDSETCVSESAEYSFVIESDCTLIAKFTVTDVEISDIAVPEISNQLISSQVTLVANNDFSGTVMWKAYDGETLASESENDVSVTAGQSKELTVNFAEDETIDRITVCVYDAYGTEKTSERSVSIVRELPTAENNSYKYVIHSNNKIEITEVKDEIGEMFEIPDVIDDYEVYAIGENLFKDEKELTEIIIPESVTQIDISAFVGCDNLKWLNFKGSIEEWNCVNLKGENIPETITVATNFENIPAKIHSINFAVVDEKEVATVNFDYAKEDADVYFAIYDSEGKMIFLKHDVINCGENSTDYEIDVAYDMETSCIKVFCWYKENTLIPVCRVYELNFTEQ